MLGVKLSEHGGDAASGDGFPATGAWGTPHLMVAILAVRKAILLEKVAVRKWLLAFPEI